MYEVHAHQALLYRVWSRERKNIAMKITATVISKLALGALSTIKAG
jgi:hypothetical protein